MNSPSSCPSLAFCPAASSAAHLAAGLLACCCAASGFAGDSRSTGGDRDLKGVFQDTALPEGFPAVRVDSPILLSVDTPRTYNYETSNLGSNADDPLGHAKKGYVGLSVGRSRFNLSCGPSTNCERTGNAIKFYAGRYFKPGWGTEVAYVRMNNLERGGTALRARALNLNVLGTAPVTSRCQVFGKLGMNYGWTDMDAPQGSGQASGSARGLGASYGTGVSVDIAPRWTALAEWNRHHLKFATGRESVDATTISLKYKY